MAFASLLANRRYRHPPFYTVCGGGLCNFGIADLDCLGQTRRFDRPLLTSGLTPETDIQLIRWHVSNVPGHKVAALQPAAREQEPRGW